MIADTNAGSRLISDIVYLTQRASGETCEITARTIERQTTRFLEKNPEEIKNLEAFNLTSTKLCQCILSLQNVTPGTGQEILAKRNALDLLLALSNELVYSRAKPVKNTLEPTAILARTA